MEFFEIAERDVTETWIQQTVTIQAVEQFCDSITLLKLAEESAQIMTDWGEFSLSRHKIKGGVRFALDDCPNALVWTLTTGFPPAPEKIVIHLTINRQEKPESFVKSVIEFGQEWRAGLERTQKTVNCSAD